MFVVITKEINLYKNVIVSINVEIVVKFQIKNVEKYDFIKKKIRAVY